MVRNTEEFKEAVEKLRDSFPDDWFEDTEALKVLYEAYAEEFEPNTNICYELEEVREIARKLYVNIEHGACYSAKAVYIPFDEYDNDRSNQWFSKFALDEAIAYADAQALEEGKQYGVIKVSEDGTFADNYEYVTA